MSKMRIVILDLFKRLYADNDIEYEVTMKSTFNNRVPADFKNVPTFSNKDSLEELIQRSVLNEKGIIALKRILWILKSNFPDLQYSPLVPYIVSILLIFLSESETYSVMTILVKHSVQLLGTNKMELRKMRYHLTVGAEEFAKFFGTFENTISKKSSSFYALISHFKKIGFDHLTFFEDMSMALYIGYLPFPVLIFLFQCVMKIFVAYLNEGIKILYRMNYAIVRVLKVGFILNSKP